jgi:hypothetical protein
MSPFVRPAASLAACLLLSVVAVGAHAQPGVTPIRVGQSLQGQLVESDEPVLSRGRFHAYRFDAVEGQRLLVTAESGDFDTYVLVGRQVGPVLDEIKSDDDGGAEGTNSRMRFTAPRTGPYVLLVQSYTEEGMGPFTVALAQAPAPTTGGSRPIAFGGMEEGQLADTDNEDDESGKFYDEYTFRGRAGQRIQVEMSSDEFDTYLELGRLDGCDFESITTDDDGGEGTGSRIRYVLAEDGEYVIRATSYSANTGPYTLSLTERVASTRAPTPITAGPTVNGALDDDDEVLEADNSYFDLYTFQGHAGEQLTINMESDEFDTYLAIGRMVGGEFEEIATMDDGGEGTNSLLEVTLDADGEYVIRANSFSAAETGSYTLRVESSRNR